MKYRSSLIVERRGFANGNGLFVSLFFRLSNDVRNREKRFGTRSFSNIFEVSERFGDFEDEFLFGGETTRELPERSEGGIEEIFSFFSNAFEKCEEVSLLENGKEWVLGMKCLNEYGPGEPLCFSKRIRDGEKSSEGALVGIPPGNPKERIRIHNSNERKVGQVPAARSLLCRDEYVPFIPPEGFELALCFCEHSSFFIIPDECCIGEFSFDIALDALGSDADMLEDDGSAGRALRGHPFFLAASLAQIFTALFIGECSMAGGAPEDVFATVADGEGAHTGA